MNAKDIVTKTFEKAKLGGGYKAEEVDEFLRDVSVEYKKLENENAELEKKLEVLAAKIREYRNDEDALRDALLIAKKQGIAVVNEAKEEAAKINKEANDAAAKTKKDADDYSAKKRAEADKTLADAKAEAKRIVDEANGKADEIHTIMKQQTEREQIVLQRTRKEVSEFTEKILAAYNVHIEYIKNIPAQCENEFVINTAKEVESPSPRKRSPKSLSPRRKSPKSPNPRKRSTRKRNPRTKSTRTLKRPTRYFSSSPTKRPQSCTSCTSRLNSESNNRIFALHTSA